VRHFEILHTNNRLVFLEVRRVGLQKLEGTEEEIGGTDQSMCPLSRRLNMA